MKPQGDGVWEGVFMTTPLDRGNDRESSGYRDHSFKTGARHTAICLRRWTVKTQELVEEARRSIWSACAQSIIQKAHCGARTV